MQTLMKIIKFSLQTNFRSPELFGKLRLKINHFALHRENNHKLI